jgi:hypothetical protein
MANRLTQPRKIIPVSQGGDTTPFDGVAAFMWVAMPLAALMSTIITLLILYLIYYIFWGRSSSSSSDADSVVDENANDSRRAVRTR